MSRNIFAIQCICNINRYWTYATLQTNYAYRIIRFTWQTREYVYSARPCCLQGRCSRRKIGPLDVCEMSRLVCGILPNGAQYRASKQVVSWIAEDHLNFHRSFTSCTFQADTAWPRADSAVRTNRFTVVQVTAKRLSRDTVDPLEWQSLGLNARPDATFNEILQALTTVCPRNRAHRSYDLAKPHDSNEFPCVVENVSFDVSFD